MKRNLSFHGVALGGAWCACLLAMSSPRSDAADPLGQAASYVVLTDLADNDPFFAAVRRLQEHRSARLIRFHSGNIAEALAPIREAQPAFVAVVVRPETLDVNLGFEMLELAVRVDADPFADFAYGFITGATADDALALVEGTIRAEAAKSPHGRRLVAFGPTSTPQADKGSAFEWLPDWKSKRIEHKPTGFPKDHLDDLATADVIRFWGHGAPDSVEGGLEQTDLAPIGLRARLCRRTRARSRAWEGSRCPRAWRARSTPPCNGGRKFGKASASSTCKWILNTTRWLKSRPTPSPISKLRPENQL